jgi:hypothetical protein
MAEMQELTNSMSNRPAIVNAARASALSAP